MTTERRSTSHRAPAPIDVLCPLSLTVDHLACMLNFELADDPVYDGGEVQWFDDAVHGTGMLAFLSRRADRRIDYYAQPGLHPDLDNYEIGGGTGSWNDAVFDSARLEVTDDGVRADVRFADVDGRRIEIRVDDRDGTPRRRAGLLAPVSAGIDHPSSLLLVWMPGFDLVRDSGTRPVIRVDGRTASIGHLPGAWLHRRHLVKYASPVIAIAVNRAHDGPVPPAGTSGRIETSGECPRISAIVAEHAGHRARLLLDPALPDVSRLADRVRGSGRWHVEVDDVRLTGGSWSVTRRADRAEVAFDVDERWRPGPLPWLMRVVTTAMPVFRRWPTSYRWRARLQLGPTPTMTSRWERTASDAAQRYRRVTGS